MSETVKGPDVAALLAAAQIPAASKPDVLAVAAAQEEKAQQVKQDAGLRGQFVFYTRMPNSTFHVQRGPSLCDCLSFKGDKLIIRDDPVAAEQLLGCADKPGSMIYTKAETVKQIESETKMALSEVMERARKDHDALAASGQRVS